MNSSTSWKLGKLQRTDWIFQRILRSVQKTGGLFNTNQEYMADDGLMGVVEEISKKQELLDDHLTSDDWLDIFIPNPYESCDIFPESMNPKETPPTDKDIDTSIAINFSEIMEDLVNLISLDKEVLELQQDLHEPSTTKLQNSDLTNGGKRAFAVCDDITISPLPDHNYHLLNEKRQKIDDSSACDMIQSTVKQPAQQPQIARGSKYFERRKKNNIASKRSRETRKHRFVEMEVQADQLEAENETLRKRIEKLEQLTQQMKEVLVNKLSASNSSR